MAVALRTERNRHIISGAIGLVLLLALITLGIKASFGAFDGGYEVKGTFAAAGQGLLPGSDVKIRGINVGEVKSIELVDNRALVKLRINDDTQIPAAAQAIVRPKTLFGEKFIDIAPGDTEMSGPYLDDGGEITDTLGGFELEQVLSDTYPVLQAIDPAELAVVFDELATAGDGLGENINRSIINAATLTELSASNDAEFRQFIGDLALLSESIDGVAPDLVAASRDLNIALPTLNDRSDQLNAALVQAARLSGDLADLFENNKAFTDAALGRGSGALQILFDRRSQIQPLLLGLTRYTQTISEALRFEVGDGTLMAAVKNLVNVQHLVATELETIGGAAGGEASDAPPVVPDPLAPVTGPATASVDPLLDLLLGGAG